MIDKFVHVPVLLDEVINALSLTKEEVYVDATFGLGGYTKAILSKQNCKVVAMDKDPQAKVFADNLKKSYEDRFYFKKGNFSELGNFLNELKINTIMIWPNADAGSDEISKEIRIFREKFSPSWLHLFVNLPIEVYIQLMNQCSCMIGNSSSAIREGETIGVPAVNVGTRQNMRLKGKNIIDVNPDKESIVEAIKRQIHHGPYKTDYLYGSGGAGEKIADILASLSIENTQKINKY